MSEEQLKYPIGKFAEPALYTEAGLNGWIKDIRDLPVKLELAVSNLTTEQLSKSYRPGGWSINQLVHHIADSHMNGLLRFKWALSENNSIIKSFDENSWATFQDYKLPVDVSLRLIDSLHTHWVCLLENIDESEWTKTYTNFQSGEVYSLKKAMALYSWHGRHHLSQIYLLNN